MEGSHRSHPADVAGLPLPSRVPQPVDPLVDQATSPFVAWASLGALLRIHVQLGGADAQVQRTIKRAELTASGKLSTLPWFTLTTKEPPMGCGENDLHWPNRKGCRLVDVDGRRCTEFIKREYCWT